MTGKPLEGWPHCVQSISVILRTRVGERIMRRAFGSLVPELQDRSAIPRNIMACYAAIAAALARWEPGFRLKRIVLKRGGADGAFVFELAGDFHPRGHLGDYSTREAVNASIGAGA